jgi:hypothetical protein
VPPLRLYDILMSHAWTYGGHYYCLVNMLDSVLNFSLRNFSVPMHDSVSERDPLHGGSATLRGQCMFRPDN